jgi:integrase
VHLKRCTVIAQFISLPCVNFYFTLALTQRKFIQVPDISSETVVLREQELNLIRRPETKNWQIHYKIGASKTWYRKTSGTSHLDEAKRIAEDLFHEARVLDKRGLAVVSKKFASVARVVSERFKKEVKAGTGKKSYADYHRAIDSYLIPFFGAYNIDRITPAVISEFHQWRKEKVGYELKASTQNNHNAALNAVFEYAIEKSYMTESQRPGLKNTGGATQSRGSFSTDELIELQAFIQQWSANARTERSRWLRELLGLYVTFVACTGVRPGTETEDLCWKHIEFVQKPNMRVIHITLPKGKRGSRTLIARNELWALLEKLRQLDADFADMTLEEVVASKSPKLLFKLRDGTKPYNLVNSFADCLAECGMSKDDKDGKARSLYSLRHYYATQRILEGVSFGQLANQMGTSVAMIERHYSHLKPLMIAEQLAGAMPDSQTAEAEEIRRLAQISPVRADVMSLIAATTGIHIALTEANPRAAEELEKELNSATAKKRNR